MIGMCPRTLVVIEEVIEGLYSFVNTSNMDTTYIALSAFDGAKDFVNLLNFTRNIVTLLLTSIIRVLSTLRSITSETTINEIQVAMLSSLYCPCYVPLKRIP